MYDRIIVHYNEIAIKGENRAFFENKLLSNINSTLKKKYQVTRRYGHLSIHIDHPLKEELFYLKEALENIPGIANFSFVKSATLDFEHIKECALLLLKELSFNSFKVDAKRSNKKFPLKSPEINALLGETILTLGKKVDVKNPEITLFVEISEKEASLFTEKFSGLGGLPVGVSSKVVCSLSGGIDSPVSSFLFMKRGCRVVFVHIYNNTLVKEEILSKIKKLISTLNKFQQNSKLYVVPFSEIQKNIIANIPSEYRMIVYRRYMFKIINIIAKKEEAKAVVTGDCLGQVASQTLENMQTIHSASSIPIFTPLIAFDKNQIIKIAKEIGTYETSIVPYPDCCSFMISNHPKTKSSLEDILTLERKIIKEEELISQAVLKADVFFF